MKIDVGVFMSLGRHVGAWKRTVEVADAPDLESTLLSSGDLSLRSGGCPTLLELCDEGGIRLGSSKTPYETTVVLKELVPPPLLMLMRVKEIRSSPHHTNGGGEGDIAERGCAFYNICGGVGMSYTQAFSGVMRRLELETVEKDLAAGKAASSDEYLHGALKPLKTRFGMCFDLFTEEGTATFRSCDVGEDCR